MSILREVAGYTLGRSDLVRRIMSKKKEAAMIAEKDVFLNGQTDKDGNVIVQGALKRGIQQDIAEELWKEMEQFAAYAFNRAHAACYGLLAYQTAWMKVNYPLEYQAAMMTNAVDNPKKLLPLYSDCRSRGIQILPPSVNRSLVDFSVADEGIRYGLVATKGVGRAIMDEIVMERSHGPYTGIQNLVERCPLASKKNVLEALIGSGALDGLGQNRAQMMAAVTPLLKLVSKARKDIAKGQMALDDKFFASDEQETSTGLSLPPYEFADVPEYSTTELLEMEMQATGMYISGHPMGEYADKVKDRVSHIICDLLETGEPENGEDEETTVSDNTPVRVAGAVSELKEFQTKKGNMMAYLTLTDLSGGIKVTLFPRTFEAVQKTLKNGSIILVYGKPKTDSFRDTVTRTLLADSIEFLDGSKEAQI